MSSVKPKQSLGQNFLVDENIARNIVDSIAPKPTDVLVEIGPGQGALTKHLVQQAQTLIAYEIDGRVTETLHHQYGTAQIHILHQDFLKADLHQLSKKNNTKPRILENIPYHLRIQILSKIIDDRKVIIDATLMIQREVADRLISKPNSKEYGILAAVSSFYGTVKKIFNVSPNCFYPRPSVTSAIIRFSLFEQLPFEVNETLLRTVIRTSFGKRRKMLRNSLSYLPFEESAIVRILAHTERWLTMRPEQLSVEQFVQLTNEIEHALNNE